MASAILKRFDTVDLRFSSSESETFPPLEITSPVEALYLKPSAIKLPSCMITSPGLSDIISLPTSILESYGSPIRFSTVGRISSELQTLSTFIGSSIEAEYMISEFL